MPYKLTPIRFTAFTICILLTFPIFTEARRSLIGEAHAEASFTGHLPARKIVLPSKPVSASPVDFALLAKAVACAETSCGTDGTAIHRNNCCGIMSWDAHGNRYPRYFRTYTASLKEAERIWRENYRAFPDMRLATKWTGNDHTISWLHTVCTVYPHPSCQE